MPPVDYDDRRFRAVETTANGEVGGGAKAAGLSAVWIGRGDPPEDADWPVGGLLDLVPET